MRWSSSLGLILSAVGFVSSSSPNLNPASVSDDTQDNVEDVIITFASFGLQDTDDEARVDLSLDNKSKEPCPEFPDSVFQLLTIEESLSDLEYADRTISRDLVKSASIPCPPRLMRRFNQDLRSGDVYSFRVLYIFYQFLELTPTLQNDPSNKKKFLRSIFDFDATSHRNIKCIPNSFLHPIVFEAMSLLGDALESYQISWLIENVPNALFDNVELMVSLKDYSFLTLNLISKIVGRLYSNKIDYLSIPNFVKTAPFDTLVSIASGYYNHAKHYKVLVENRKNLIQEVESIKDNPLAYPFLSQFSFSQGLPRGYNGNSSLITARIRGNVLTIGSLSALLAYIQESNNYILESMTDIAVAWAETHKNSHLDVLDEAKTEKNNKEFNELIQRPFDNLGYLRREREDINELIRQLEAKEILTQPRIIESDPEWIDHLKILAQVPFSGFLRSSFMYRCELGLQSVIHPDDENNYVKLPRLSPPESTGFMVKADPSFTFSPLLWSSLWRNIFYVDGEFWRQDSEAMRLAESGSNLEFAAYLKPQFEIIYRDSVSSSTTSVDLLSAWRMLSVLLDETFRTGPRLCRFIASITVPPTPSGLNIHPEYLKERESFAQKVKMALSDIESFDFDALNVIKANFSDIPQIVSYIDTKLSMKDTLLASPLVLSTSIEDLTYLCRSFNSAFMKCTNKSEKTLFQHSIHIKNAFLSLGPTLTDIQIIELATNADISMYLAIIGRGLSRSQVANLIKSESGKRMLRANIPFALKLIDYSEFSFKDFQDTNIKIEDILYNTSTISNLTKELLLTKQGFSNLKNPLRLAHSLGQYFWNDVTLFKHLSYWEMLTPMVLAFDPQFANDAKLIDHMTQIECKLHSGVKLNVAVKFLIKWLIAQDWYAFQYHVVLAKGESKFGALFIQNLRDSYQKYMVEGEIPARKAIMRYIERVVEAVGSVADGTHSELANLCVVIDTVPLTLFRAGINASGSNVARLLASPYRNTIKVSTSMILFISMCLQKYFKDDEYAIWFARFEILCQFNSDENGQHFYAIERKSNIRSRLNNLSIFDALIYKWGLEVEGFNVENVYDDSPESDQNLLINESTRVGVIPRLCEQTITASAAVDSELKSAAGGCVVDKKEKKKDKKDKKRI